MIPLSWLRSRDSEYIAKWPQSSPQLGALFWRLVVPRIPVTPERFEFCCWGLSTIRSPSALALDWTAIKVRTTMVPVPTGSNNAA